MNDPPAPAKLLGAALAALLLCAPAAIPAAADPHDFTDEQCNWCHKDIEGENEDLRDDADSGCLRCHGGCPHGRKHSGGETTLAAMREPLPLDRRGRMACHTCHDPHMGAEDPASRSRTAYLRILNPKRELCLNCHRVGGSNGAVRP